MVLVWITKLPRHKTQEIKATSSKQNVIIILSLWPMKSQISILSQLSKILSYFNSRLSSLLLHFFFMFIFLYKNYYINLIIIVQIEVEKEGGKGRSPRS